MRFLILFLLFFSSNCLSNRKNYMHKEIVFPPVYCSSSLNGRVFNEYTKLEDLDGKCIKKDLVLSFEETNEAICTFYVNGKEVGNGHTLANGSHEIKVQVYRNGLIKTKSIFLKIEKEEKGEKFNGKS